MIPVTVILTSCERIDLLVQTLDSFHQINTYPVQEFHIHEDGADVGFDGLKKKYPHIQWHFSGERIGLSASLDYLISLVKTEYYFSSENDWSYYGNKSFISDSLKIMQADSSIHQVWIRDHNDHRHPLGSPITINGIKCREVKKGYQKDWGGFSTNPSLRRLSDTKNFFPNGLKEYGDEIECSKHVDKMGYKAVSLFHSTIKHIGWERHTKGFKV